LLRKNSEIYTAKVNLIDENGTNLGEVSLDQALYLSYEKGYDLVEVGPSAHPPICKLMDYGKYIYEQEKKIKKQKAKTKTSELKEIKLSLKIDDHDFNFKADRAIKFLKEGHKVRAFLFLKGRESMYSQKAFEILEKFKNQIAGEFERSESATKVGAAAKVEFEKAPERLGSRYFATIVAKKSKEKDAKI
jgi:translation initiation factor IF-3